MTADENPEDDPGLYGEEPTEEEWAEEKQARARWTVAELLHLDLADPNTPSRRAADGGPEPGSVAFPREDL
jgi:hypothetical protein